MYTICGVNPQLYFIKPQKSPAFHKKSVKKVLDIDIKVDTVNADAEDADNVKDTKSSSNNPVDAVSDNPEDTKDSNGPKNTDSTIDPEDDNKVVSVSAKSNSAKGTSTTCTPQNISVPRYPLTLTRLIQKFHHVFYC